MALADMVSAMNTASMRMLANATATWRPSNGGATQSASVVLGMADHEQALSDISVIDRRRSITYLNTDFIGLDSGESITIAGVGYIVREVMQLDDAMMEATLGAYEGA